MNFDTFIDRYKDEIVTIHKELQLLSIPKDTLRQMLTDLYNEGYNDGAVREYDLISSDDKIIGSYKA